MSDNSSGLSGYGLVVVHMVAGWCFIAGPFGAWHELLKRPFAEKFKRIWLSYFGVCVLVSTLVFFIWRPEYPSINLKLVTSHAPNNILDLSNCRLPFILRRRIFMAAKHDRDIPTIIPLSSDESDVGMLFQVLSSDEIDNLEVFIGIYHSKLTSKMEDGWTHNINVSGLASKNFHLKQVNSNFPRIFLQAKPIVRCDASAGLKSARGLAHSKSWRKMCEAIVVACVLDCGSPPPLSLRAQPYHVLMRGFKNRSATSLLELLQPGLRLLPPPLCFIGG